MTVFVVQQPVRRFGDQWRPTVDISPARAFGKLQFLMIRPGNIFLDALPNVIDHMRDSLKNFGDSDFLLPTGEPLAIAIAAILAACANHGRVHVLKWDGRAASYQPVTINVGV